MKHLLLALFCCAYACMPAPPATGQSATGQPAPTTPPDLLFGELFHRVQMEQVYPDGKSFVDMIPQRDPEAIIEDYRARKDGDNFELKTFVEENFDPPASYASGFASDDERSITEHINALWPVLTREAGAGEGDDGSLLPLPNDYVVPGGRFREIYYWDSYFTMLGLREAGREDLIREMVENFAYLIDTYGFIPNGNRSYYLTRSQPPFFSHMVELLTEIDGEAVSREFYPQLEAEYAFWMDGVGEVSENTPAIKHVVRMPDGSILNRYYDAGERPRAESYREDVLTIRESGRDSQLVARHLRAGAASGWDYSSRWFADGQNISSIVTTDIVPPDLNSLLFHLERMLERYATEPDSEYAGLSEARRQAVDTWLWNTETTWYEDYDWRQREHTGRLSLAGMYPFFVGLPENAYDPDNPGDLPDGRSDAAALQLEDSFMAPGGLRATLSTTGQQWDAPNGWPPLQWVAYIGLKKYGYGGLADDVRRRWLSNNERVYENVGKMVEKYNVEDISLEAGGGEYPVQDGFGWSNGVYLAMKADTL